jgi:acyl-CoA thioesterase-1
VPFFALALSAVLAAPVAPASAGPDDRATLPRIVALGDSLTSGRGIGSSTAFPAVLQQELDREGFHFQVVNAGISGATSATGLRRVRDVLDDHVRILIVALGANDGLRGVSVAQLKSNLSQIIEIAQKRGIAVLLCGMEALPVHGWDYSVAFHYAYRELADRYNVPLVPFMLANVIGRGDMMQRDHIHPNVAGAQAIAANIWPYLKPLVEMPVSN